MFKFLSKRGWGAGHGNQTKKRGFNRAKRRAYGKRRGPITL